ncbi:MAG: hypothetical protein Q7S80_01525 [bacterium]|nr:hypothetical protein [bacterium]
MSVESGMGQGEPGDEASYSDQLAERMETANPELAREIEHGIEGLRAAIYTAAERAESQPKLRETMVRSLEELGSNLQTSAFYGQSDQPIAEGRLREIVAVLEGAALAADLTAERTSLPKEVEPSDTAHLRKFLDLVNQRVGSIDPNNPKESRLKVRVHGSQGREVRHTLT